MAKASLSWMAVFLLGCGSIVSAQKLYPDDPLWEDNDRLDTPVPPAEVELSDLYDRFGHMLHDFGASPLGSEAANVNTLDEVPDSSWFTNRHGARRMSIEELRRGPNRSSGPDPRQKWLVFRGKSQGLTPGFQIRDEKGDRYVIKLDPVDIPEMASAAEIIATKIFYAAGYNVPENYLVFRNPAEIEIEGGTLVEDRFGDKVPLTPFRFRRMIRRVPLRSDGTARLLASKYVPGKPLGPFRYYGTRSDDPNDVIAHEDRRELRGLRLIAAWTHHDDTRAHNTQDTWVEEGRRHYVRHYLMDFGSTFGSGSVGMQLAHLGLQDSVDLRAMERNLLSFGLRVPTYRKAKWPEFPKYQAVGRWEAEQFDPGTWKNNYPNPAFVRMTPRDAFWAAKIIMRFTRDELAAIVETGQFSDPDNAAYFLNVLLARQRKCGRFGINGINPLDRFAVRDGALEFANLSERYGFAEGQTTYRVRWWVYDNVADEAYPLKGPFTAVEPRLELPERDYYRRRPRFYLMVEISSMNGRFPHWRKPLRVYLRGSGQGYTVVAIERSS